MWASLASFSRISVRTSTHSPSFGAGCTPRSYRNSVALPRITLRTVARDTDSVLTISLIGKCRSKNARRIWPILSTPIIPISSSRPPQATEGDIDETSEGSRLDAKNPPSGGHYCERAHSRNPDCKVNSIEPRPVDTDGLVAGLGDLTRRTMGPGITVELKLRDGAGSVLCDPNELESALLNLCINARDAMPEG